MVHRRAGEQRRDRHAVGAGLAVGQDDDVDAVAHGLLGLSAQRLDRLFHPGRAFAGGPGGVERRRLELSVAELRNLADLLQVVVGQDRLADFEALGPRHAFEVEQVRPRPDDRDEAHHDFFADRIDRRVRDLREVLLEIGEEQLRLVRQRRDRRVGAHRADGFFAHRRHRRHQELEVFLRVTERLLAIEQRQVRDRRFVLRGRQVLHHDLGPLEPFLVRMALGERGLELFVRDQAALFEVDQQHLARLQSPLGDDVLLRDRQHAHLGSHDDAVVAGHEVARRTKAVAVERRADLAAVGEGERRGSVPRLHQRGVVFVERAALLVHHRIARPRFGHHHHHGVRERVAALHQEFERVVEAGGVGLALVGDRPQLADVVAIELRRHRRLPRRHPVVVAAQRVDLAVVRDHPVRMRQRPGRERVGREPLVHQRQRAFEIRLVQVAVVGAELVGEEHALVDDGAARHRHRVIAGQPPLVLAIDRGRDRLAQDVELALEFVLAEFLFPLSNEHLHVDGFGRRHRDAERRIVGRDVGAPAEQLEAFLRGDLFERLAHHVAAFGVARHEQHADAVLAGLRQRDAELLRLAREELVRDLHQDAGAVAGARIGADRAAMLEIAENLQRVLHDLLGLAALDVGNEADAAGILGESGIVEAASFRQAGVRAVLVEQTRIDRGRGCRRAVNTAVLSSRPSSFALSRLPSTGSRHTQPRPQHRLALRPKANRK